MAGTMEGRFIIGAGRVIAIMAPRVIPSCPGRSESERTRYRSGNALRQGCELNRRVRRQGQPQPRVSVPAANAPASQKRHTGPRNLDYLVRH